MSGHWHVLSLGHCARDGSQERRPRSSGAGSGGRAVNDAALRVVWTVAVVGAGLALVHGLLLTWYFELTPQAQADAGRGRLWMWGATVTLAAAAVAAAARLCGRFRCGVSRPWWSPRR